MIDPQGRVTTYSYDSGTDTTSVANHIVYDAYGRIISESNSAVDFLYGFTGRERDTESDLQYNRARYYDAATGRWLSQDPIGFDAGDANLYRYVGNSAAMATDESGHSLNPWNPNFYPYRWCFGNKPAIDPKPVPPPAQQPWVPPGQGTPTSQYIQKLATFKNKAQMCAFLYTQEHLLRKQVEAGNADARNLLGIVIDLQSTYDCPGCPPLK